MLLLQYYCSICKKHITNNIDFRFLVHISGTKLGHMYESAFVRFSQSLIKVCISSNIRVYLAFAFLNLLAFIVLAI